MFDERSEWKMTNLRNCLSPEGCGADILAGAKPSPMLCLLSAFLGQPFFVFAFSLLTVQSCPCQSFSQLCALSLLLFLLWVFSMGVSSFSTVGHLSSVTFSLANMLET